MRTMIIDGNCQFYGKADLAGLLGRMDAAGIDKVLLSAALEGAVVPGRNKPLAGVGNAEVAAAVAAHPDRLIGSFHAIPLAAGALQSVAEYAAKGFKAVKLFPGEGWHPDDPAHYPFFDAVQDAGLAAIVQCGIAGFTLSHEAGTRRALNASYAYPMRLDAPSRLFPRIRFVVLRMGFPFLFEAWSVHHANKNIFLDLSGTGPAGGALPVGYAAVGGPAFIPLDFDKVVWGSDNATDLKACLAVADSHLGMMGCADPGRRARVLGANAAHMLGIAG
jgi:predicted TIM-barrel fold metal-dependent hydrolase